MNRSPVPHSCRIHTAEQSAEIDAETIQTFGIDGHTLMEIAGETIARHLIRRTRPGDRGLILCGKGNNGGDGLAAARYLVQHERPVTVVFLSGTGDLSRDAERNLNLLRTLSAEDPGLPLSLVERWDDFAAATAPAAPASPDEYSPRFGFIVDGMLGTGLTQPLRGDYEKAVQYVNRAAVPVYAIDMPTGLHADRGEPLGTAVRADETFVCGTRKPGYYFGTGPEHCGRITWCDLPFPGYLRNRAGIRLIDRSWLPGGARPPARHKYEAGVLYLIAGSEGLSGAAMMCAESAWGTGVGAVIWLCPRGLLTRLEGALPQVIKRPVGEPEDLHFREAHLPEVQAVLAEKEGTVAIGPGLGRDPDTDEFVRLLLGSTPLPFLIDADAIRALAKKPIQRPGDAEWILTPHPGELRSLLEGEAGEGFDRLEKVTRFSREHGITLLSKGYPVIIGTAGGEACITGYDTRVFARAGFGDVLTGKVAGYWAGGRGPLNSCGLALVEGHERIRQLKAARPGHTPQPTDLI